MYLAAFLLILFDSPSFDGSLPDYMKRIMGDIKLDSRTRSMRYASSSSMLREVVFSYMTVLLNTVAVANFDKRLAMKFCSWGTSSTLKERKRKTNFILSYDILSTWAHWPDIFPIH